MLRRAKEKVEKKVGEIFIKANTTERQAKDAEAALRKTVEENSRLLDKVAEFEAQVKRNAAASEEKSRLQKKIRELKVQLGAEEKRTAEVASKAMEDFRASEEYEKERAEYSVDAYDVERQSIRVRIAVKYLDLDLNLLDEI